MKQLLLLSSVLFFGIYGLANPMAGTWLGQAEGQFLDADYELTISTCDRILAAAPQVNDARFLRGMSRFHQKKLDLAYDDLAMYIKDEGNYLQEAEQMVGLLEKKLKDAPPRVNSPTTLTRRLDGGSASTDDPDQPIGVRRGPLAPENASGIPDGSETGLFNLPMRYRVSAGLQYDSRVLLRPLDEAAIEEPEISDIAINLRGGVQWIRPEGGPIARYDGNWLIYNEARRESRLAQKLELGWHQTWLDEALDVEVVGFGDLILLDNEEYRQRYGGRLGVTHFSGIRRDWFQGGLGDDSYREFSDYNGGYYSLNLGQDYVLGDWVAGWNAGYLAQSAALKEVEFTEKIAGVSLRYSVSDSLQTGGAVVWIDNPYDRFDPVFEDRRDDQFITAQWWMSYAITDSFSIEPSITYINRDSSVDSLAYDRFIAEINTVLTRW